MPSKVWYHFVNNFRENANNSFSKSNYLCFSNYLFCEYFYVHLKLEGNKRRELFIMTVSHRKLISPQSFNPLFFKIPKSDRFCCDFVSFMLIYLLMKLFYRWKYWGYMAPVQYLLRGIFIFYRNYPFQLYVIELPPGRGVAHLSRGCQVWFCVYLVLVDLKMKASHYTVSVQLNFR